MCPNCGLAYELDEHGLVSFAPLSAAMTTELAFAGLVHYLAAWRVTATVSVEDPTWERVRRTAAPGPAYLYVPAFTLARAVVQQLGVSLTETQPALELTPGLEEATAQRPSLVEVGAAGRFQDAIDVSATTGPGFGAVSPVVVGREDARVLARFVYMAVQSHESRDLRSIRCDLEPAGQELIFIPAVWDPRYIHESNWRLLLREFDGLVA
ncbi:MAG: hypothetical protein A2133_10690 [Actinobacteria bacterium RBG_16_64_13]|nr:MAG: hypothetical protein A2133_10690 [Actinobacteria bacterium RBG_16_64_13]